MAVSAGDVLEVGVFRLAVEPDRTETLPAADPPETNEIHAELPVAGAAPQPPADAASGTPDDLAAVLYRLSQTLLTVTDPDVLMDRFLAEALSALPGDGIALVRADPLTGRLEVRARRERRAGPAVPGEAGSDAPRISRTLVTRCMEERRALLVDNVDGHPSLGDQTSVARHRIRSLMCAPLPAPPGRRSLPEKPEKPDKAKSSAQAEEAPPLGAVCVVSRRLDTAFNESALRRLATLCNLAALALAGALERRRLAEENAALKGGPALSRLLTADARMKEILAAVLRVAALNTTVLITGETGSGKELIAAAVHENSLRCKGPLVKINCAAISESLLESELFGHERGAFTDARTRRIGKLEAAHGGTLFLDEVGEMSPAVQAKLLRALEQREFERLGGNETVRVDVRFVAATHRDLRKMVDDGRFREDLFYRLSVMPIRLPPLRERAGDIPHLAAHFLREFAASAGCEAPAPSEPALRRLTAYRWPGNVRELRNVMERLVILHAGRTLSEADVADALGPGASSSGASGAGASGAGASGAGASGAGASGAGDSRPPLAGSGSGESAAPAEGGAAGETLADARTRFENEMIRRTLGSVGGNVTEAAKRLGMTREALSRRIHREKPQ
jgi:DNA-binding NtrC family response regulator